MTLRLTDSFGIVFHADRGAFINLEGDYEATEAKKQRVTGAGGASEEEIPTTVFAV